MIGSHNYEVNAMAEEKKQTRRKQSDRLKPLSLHPLTPEKAFSVFMQVKPKKIKGTVTRKIKK